MAQFVGDVNRKLVPRWRSSELTITLGERSTPSPVPHQPSIGVDDFEEKRTNWQTHPAISSAAELVAAAFVHSRLEQAREAAEFLLRHDRSTSGLLRDVALRATEPFDLKDPDEQQSAGRQIRSEREVLALEPRNPFKWVDLARNYLLIGRVRKASRAMDVALQLAPNDVFVARSATRLYVHLRQPDRAHCILSSIDALPYDPALLAAEIVVSALMKKKSRFLRRGLQVLESKDYAESRLTELAAVIATEELCHGPGRKARRLFRRSLISPNENTVAQVRWAASHAEGIPFNAEYLQVARSFEARAWNQFYKGDWHGALVQSKAWLSDQGFSRRPAGLGSFVAAVVMEDHVEAISVVRRALIANPRDPLLLNNLAYSLACMGKLDEAERALQQMTLVGDDSSEAGLSTVKAATAGLLEYRKGNRELGQRLYRKAYESASQSGLDRLRARVVMFFAMEEARSAGDRMDPAVHEAFATARKTEDPVLKVLASRVLKLLGNRETR